jgi:DNA-binding NarL/FixJ family response regulator
MIASLTQVVPVPEALPYEERTARGQDPPRILVVDDDQGFREMLRDFLADDGFDVIGEAPDGAEAFSLAERLHPDVVLMDLRMPKMDGLEATRRIKAVLPITQVIMLSAYEDPALKRGAEEVGVYCYLIKGCPPAILIDMLRFAWSFKVALQQNDSPRTPHNDSGAPSPIK